MSHPGFEPERPHDQLRAYSKASFTHIVNVTVSGIVSGTFDLFDGHFDEQNGCATHFAHQSVPPHDNFLTLTDTVTLGVNKP